MITIDVKPARRRFSGRKQCRYTIIAGNGTLISDRDTYANPGDIRAIMATLVDSDEPVQLRVHYVQGTVTERLR